MPLSTSHPSPHFSRVPGRKFSMRMSASCISRFTTSCASAWRRSSVTDCLLRDWAAHHTEVPLCSKRHLRKGSPVTGGSILMTSAPNSARIFAAKGPAISCPISTTLMPSSGRLMTFSVLVGGSAWIISLKRRRENFKVFHYTFQNGNDGAVRAESSSTRPGVSEAAGTGGEQPEPDEGCGWRAHDRIGSQQAARRTRTRHRLHPVHSTSERTAVNASRERPGRTCSVNPRRCRTYGT
ncbi:hypothetical protein D3C80_1106550 [compost metagenome]